jgi:hypothetical protein
MPEKSARGVDACFGCDNRASFFPQSVKRLPSIP